MGWQGGQTQPQQPPSLTLQSWGLWAASVLGRVILACLLKALLLLWGVGTERLTEPLNNPEKSPLPWSQQRGAV